MDKLEKILRKYLENGSDTIDVTMVLALIQQCKKDIKKLTLTDVLKQSELLIAFAEWKEYNGKWETHEQQVKNFLKEYG
jgi:hypothetical protein